MTSSYHFYRLNNKELKAYQHNISAICNLDKIPWHNIQSALAAQENTSKSLIYWRPALNPNTLEIGKIKKHIK